VKGVVKLLDFGLAKQRVRELGPDDETGAALTKEGNITGILQYMSPEQLQGKEADARSDIFALGCVLYEMLSGKKAFSGSTTASVIAAIMEREPKRLQTTPPLDRVIRTCLAKDPDDRFQTARDLERNLLWAMGGESASSAPSRSRFSTLALRRRCWRLAWRQPPGLPTVRRGPRNSSPSSGWMSISGPAFRSAPRPEPTRFSHPMARASFTSRRENSSRRHPSQGHRQRRHAGALCSNARHRYSHRDDHRR
jgi:serine/threonine protein kinase